MVAHLCKEEGTDHPMKSMRRKKGHLETMRGLPEEDQGNTTTTEVSPENLEEEENSIQTTSVVMVGLLEKEEVVTEGTTAVDLGSSILIKNKENLEWIGLASARASEDIVEA
jgi:hypothetical protein